MASLILNSFADLMAGSPWPPRRPAQILRKWRSRSIRCARFAPSDDVISAKLYGLPINGVLIFAPNEDRVMKTTEAGE